MANGRGFALGGVLIFGVTAFAFAQSPPALSESIVVTADRTVERLEDVPASVTVLTRRDIERLPARSLAELLAALPALDVDFGDGSTARPIVSSRGFFGGGEVEYVKLLVDGVASGDPETGLVDWRSIPASSIERVEVLHGPASALYGDGSVGGVVQVFTRRDAGSHAHVSVDSGTAGASGVTGWASVPVGTFELIARMQATHGDGWRTHSSASLATGALSLGFRDDNGEWRLSVGGDHTNRDDPGPLPLSIAREDPSRSESLYRDDNDTTAHRRASLRGSRHLGTITLDGSAFLEHRSTDLLRSLLLVPTLGDRALRMLRTGNRGGSLLASSEWILLGRPAETRAAIDLTDADISSAYFAVTPGGGRGAQTADLSAHREQLGVSFANDFHPTDRVRITFGARHDSLRDRDGGVTHEHSPWSPRIAVSRTFGDHASAYAQLSRAFRAPSIDQLTDARAFPDFRGGTFTISNPSLAPEYAQTIEAGIAQSAGAVRWNAVVYQSRVTDEIDFDPATFRYRNIGSSRHRGLELAAAGMFHGVEPSLSYDWTRVESLDNGGGAQLKNIPKHVVRAGVSAPLPLALYGTLRWTLKSGRFLDDEERFPLGTLNTIDASLRRDLGRARIELHLLNLLGRNSNALGFVLTDFRGEAVPYVYPSERFTARLVVGWTD
jgi:vitamin B12 transporter